MTIQKRENSIVKQNNISDLYKNNYLFAGLKVCDLAGGPDLIIVGFLPWLPLWYVTIKILPERVKFFNSENINTLILIYYPKVYFRRQDINIKDIIEQDIDEKYNEYNYLLLEENQIINQWVPSSVKILGDYSPNFTRKLLVLCKYWSQKDEEFKYVFKAPYEITLVQ